MLDAWTSTRYTQYRPDLKSTLRLPFFFFGKIEDRAFYLFQNWKQSRLKLMTSLNSFFTLPTISYFFVVFNCGESRYCPGCGGRKRKKGRPTSKLERKKKVKKRELKRVDFLKFIMNKNPSGIVKSTRKKASKAQTTNKLSFFLFLRLEL